MPILDVEIVGPAESGLAGVSAQSIADVSAAVLRVPPGRLWVRLRHLAAEHYAENGMTVGAAGWPVFVTVLHAHPPQGEGLQAELHALTGAIARVLARPAERVHVQYAPAAAGRQAFGGRLVE